MIRHKYSLLLAILSCFISLFLSTTYNGFERGFDYAAASYKDCIGMGFSGGTAYGSLANQHIQIFLSMASFCLMKALSDSPISKGVCILLLIFAVIKNAIWYLGVDQIGGYHDPFYEILRETIVLGWLSCLLNLGLLIIHLYGLRSFPTSRRATGVR